MPNELLAPGHLAGLFFDRDLPKRADQSKVPK